MLKWCQVRVFLLTCLGVLIGNIVATRLNLVPLYVVAPCGFAGWLSGNALNAWIAKRGAACQPVMFPQLDAAEGPSPSGSPRSN